MFRDFKDLLFALNAHRVRYLVIGGYAVSFYAQPRATKDLDILISPDVQNSKAVFAALTEFGAPVSGLSSTDFTEADSFFRMGSSPVMVDILTRIQGVEFEEAWRNRISVTVDGELDALFISREDLIANKTAAGRSQDLSDLDALRAASNQIDPVDTGLSFGAEDGANRYIGPEDDDLSP